MFLAAAVALAEEPAKDKTPQEISGLGVDLTPRKAIALSMEDAIRMTLENNMDIKISRIDPQTSAADIHKALARFDWTFEASWSRKRDKQPSASVLAGAAASMSDTDDVRLGLKKTLTTGGTIEPGVTWR